MKKIKAILLIFIILGALTLTSCKSTSKCAAYGETSKFQIDNPH